jgi:hypothetical protein
MTLNLGGVSLAVIIVAEYPSLFKKIFNESFRTITIVINKTKRSTRTYIYLVRAGFINKLVANE